ncbi:MAG: recombination-associated protein RdgC [Azoarcus sp.]|jgi:recombination associated protein RdgC|nr:recombination-associated protein RdgC [Azoarcus sp.]
MWFRNLQVFRLRPGWDANVVRLDESLQKYPLQPCGSQEMESRGWIPPRDGDALVRVVGGQWLMAMGVEARLLPTAVVKQETETRVQTLAEKQGYKPGRATVKEMREQVLSELMPRAFIRSRRTWVWVDPVGGWLGIDASSPARAEEVLECLRLAIDDFPLLLLRTERSPMSAMADWLAGEAPAGFTVDEDCELRSTSEEKATVRYAHHPLDGNEIKEHLTAGKLPTRLALTFNDRVSFVLTDKLELKRLDFLDTVREELGNEDDAEALFDSEFALMTGELSRLLPALVEVLGGTMKPEAKT